MSKYIQFLLVIAYGVITIAALVLVWLLFTLGSYHLEDLVVFLIMAGWLIVCFSAVFWLTDIHLFFRPVRKPILEEEQRLTLCIYEVQKRTRDNKQYRLYIMDDKNLNAYAIGYHTIVVAKGCLELLTEEELSALLAHEMGHLRTRDCMAVMAFSVANYLPGIIYRLFNWGVKITMIISTAVIIIGIVALLYIFSHAPVFIYVATILAFMLLLQIINPVFRFLWLLNSRFTEYRQDAFAQKLGFGLPLKRVLLKIIETSPPHPVNRYFIVTRSSHPVLHNRIRRLEKLEGLRK